MASHTFQAPPPGSELAGLGIPETPRQVGTTAPIAEEEPVQYDLSQAVQDDQGVWIRQGEDFYTITPDKIGEVAGIKGVRFATPQEVQGRKDEKRTEAARHASSEYWERFALFAGMGALVGASLLGVLPAIICAWWTFLYGVSEISRAVRSP